MRLAPDSSVVSGKKIMELIKDGEQYDELQQCLLKELKEGIAMRLHDAGLMGEKLQEATDEVAFTVAAILDASQIMEHKGKDVLPYLAFQNPDNEEQLIHAGGNSWMHEYVFE